MAALICTNATNISTRCYRSILLISLLLFNNAAKLLSLHYYSCVNCLHATTIPSKRSCCPQRPYDPSYYLILRNLTYLRRLKDKALALFMWTGRRYVLRLIVCPSFSREFKQLKVRRWKKMCVATLSLLLSYCVLFSSRSLLMLS